MYQIRISSSKKYKGKIHNYKERYYLAESYRESDSSTPKRRIIKFLGNKRLTKDELNRVIKKARGKE